jgi:hypothetical protein
MHHMSEVTISARTALGDQERVERALLAAARDAASLHRFHNVPMATWRENAACTITPDEFDAMLDERELALNEKYRNGNTH